MAGSGGASQYALLAEGYEVITATDAFEALNILRGAYPELLITELICHTCQDSSCCSS